MRRRVLVPLATLAGVLLVRQRARASGDAVVRRFFEAWESGDGAGAAKLVTKDYAGHVNALAGLEHRNRGALAEVIEAQAQTFEKRRFSVEDLVSTRDRAAARVCMQARHADSGRDVEMEGLAFFRLEDGRIAEEWSSWDYLGLAEQLGVVLRVEDGASSDE